MLAFACPVCARLVTFESTTCLHCRSELGLDFDSATMRAVGFVPGEGGTLHRCANATIAACNWLVRASGELCVSCALTRTRPNDHDPDGLGGLRVAEAAKRRLVFELGELGLPLHGFHDQDGALAFDLLSSDTEAVSTGHADGVITLDLDETDPGHREQMRVRLGEPYRTVLGHLRHEVGHYYEPILVADGSDDQRRCREVFGDERADYQEAMDRYYRDGPPAGWEQSFVSAYAAMHPFEDWAETFAHYLHIRDTLQTAATYGLRSDGPQIPTADGPPLHFALSEATIRDVRSMVDAWLPLTYALNAVNRSMGEGDLYPFVVTPQIEAKLSAVHVLIQQTGRMQ